MSSIISESDSAIVVSDQPDNQNSSPSSSSASSSSSSSNSSDTTSSSSFSHSLPLPSSELDVLRNRYVGLKIIGEGRVDIVKEGHHLKQWVLESDLLTTSTVQCQYYYPYQPRRIVYQVNEMNVITWVRYG